MDDYSHIPAPPPPPVPSFDLTPVSPPQPSASRRSRRGLLAGVGVLAVLAIVGGVFLASRGGSSSDPQQVLARVASASEAEKSVRFELSVKGPELPTPLVLTGAMDFTTKVSRFDMDLSSFASQLPESAALPGDAKVQVISQGTVVYLKMAGLEKLTGGASWVKIDASKLPSGTDAFPTGLPQAGTGDPRVALDVLRSQAESVEDLGKETVDGVETTHYRAVFDLAKLAADSGASRAELQKALAELTDTKLTYDLNVDGDRLLRRLAFTANTTEGAVTVTMRFTDYGKPVGITVPADADVIDLTSIIGGK